MHSPPQPRREAGRHRTLALAVATAAIVLGLVGVATKVGAADDVPWGAVQRFDRFLDDHPWVARDLQRDPTLANDDRYLDDHRSLREFLAKYPGVRRELRQDPYAVLRREHRVEREQRGAREITRDEMQRFDRFLRDHPGVAHELRDDPSLVNSRGYLGDHPGFRDFLHDHPAIRQELQSNPYAFMRRWERSAHHADGPARKPAEHR
jgi:phage-related protein